MLRLPPLGSDSFNEHMRRVYEHFVAAQITEPWRQAGPADLRDPLDERLGPKGS